jgi:flagellar motility protein MotE (MotC chaperone)
MNQRNANEVVFIPQTTLKNKISNDEQTPEDLVFDKAIESEKIEIKKDQLEELELQLQLLKEKKKGLKKEEDIQKNELSLKTIDKLKAKVEKSIDENNEKGTLNK